MKNKLLSLAFLVLGSVAYSQVGIETLTPNNSSQLEIFASDKGILIPKIALISPTDSYTIKPENVNSLLVFNTSNNNLMKSGYYYWFHNQWLRLAHSVDLEDIVNSTNGPISLEVINSNLVLTDIFRNQAQIPLLDINIITPLINNQDGTYTYTSENSTITTIEVPADVINNFEEIFNNQDVINKIINNITNTKVGGNVYYDGSNFTYVDGNCIIKKKY